MFPIDREYTQTFFRWRNPEFQEHPQKCFEFAFQEIAKVARQTLPAKFVGPGWNTCRSKVLDNAVVGFCRFHGLVSDNTKYRRKKQKAFQDVVKKAEELGILDQIEAEAERRISAKTETKS